MQNKICFGKILFLLEKVIWCNFHVSDNSDKKTTAKSQDRQWQQLSFSNNFDEKTKAKSQDPRDEERMENLGKQMVKHCGGLPLAIVVFGGLLVTRHNSSEWEMVSQNISSYIRAKALESSMEE